MLIFQFAVFGRCTVIWRHLSFLDFFFYFMFQVLTMGIDTNIKEKQVLQALAIGFS